MDSLSYLGEGNELSNYNLYAYCGNNPVMYKDKTGKEPVDTTSWVIDVLENVAECIGHLFDAAAKMFSNEVSSATSSAYSGGGVYRVYPTGLADRMTANANTLSANADACRLLGKGLKGIGIGLLAYDCYLSYQENFSNPNLSEDRKVTDTVVDIACEVGQYAAVWKISTSVGAAINPVIGTVIGFAAGVVITLVMEFTPIEDWMKDGFNWFANEVGLV